MVKMTLGSSQSQGTTAISISESRVSAYESLINSLNNFAGEDGLTGNAYDSAKSYATSVMVPLIQGAILLSEGVGQPINKLPGKYESEVGSEDLDSAVLEAEIEAYNMSIKAQQNNYRTMQGMSDIPASTLESLQSTLNDTISLRSDVQEKLRKLNAFADSSNSVFDDLPSDIESALATGLKQMGGTFSSFHNTDTFVLPSDISWTKTIDKEWKVREDLLADYEKIRKKAKKDPNLTDEEKETIEKYFRRYPNREIPEELQNALKDTGFYDYFKNLQDQLNSGSYLSSANVALKEGIASVKKIKNGTWYRKPVKSTKSGFKTWRQVNGDVNRFKIVKESKNIDEILNGTGTISRNSGIKGAAKSVGVLGGSLAVLDGGLTYLERREEYGETSARIDGVAHTASSVGALYVGAAVGSAIPIPVVGTVAGAAVGYIVGGALNSIYDGIAHGKWDWSNFALW